MKYAKLEYNLQSHLVFVFDKRGDLVVFKVNGVDKSQNGDAIENGLAAVCEAGKNLQEDISIAFDTGRNLVDASEFQVSA